MILDGINLDHMRMACICGAIPEKVEHVIIEGEIRNGKPSKIKARFERALYYDAKHDRDFCSAACMLRWAQLFARPFAQHLGAKL